MLFSPGWRAPAKQRTVLALFSVGLAAGGGTTATVLWLLSGLARPVPAAAGAVAALGFAALGVLRETGLVRLWLPQTTRQIPADVLQTRVLSGSLRFGFELGTGVRTFLPSCAPHVIALGLLVTHPPIAVFLAAGIGFGAGRAATAALSYAARDPLWERRLTARLSWIKTGAAVTVLAAEVVLLAR
jgi:hypothetical protein